MYDEHLKALLEERARATGDLQKFHQEAEKRASEKDSVRMLAEDQQEWDRRTADLDDMDLRIKQIKDRVEGDKQADEYRSSAEHLLRPQSNETRDDDPWLAQEKKIANFFTEDQKTPGAIEVSLRGLDLNNFDSGRRIVRESRTLSPVGSEERTGLVDGTNSAGGYLFGPSFRTVLYQHLIFHSAIRQTRASVLTTGGGENLLLPKTTVHPASGTIVSEAAVIGEADPTFGQGTLSAYKYANIVLLSSELEQDTQVDLLGYLAKIMGQRLGDGMGADFVTGSGTNKPQGVLVGVGAATGTIVTGGTPAASGATFAELTQVKDAIIPPYQQFGEWFMGQPAMQKIRALVNTQGTPIFLPSLSGDSPDTLFGQPIILDPNMPAPASNASSIAYGDFSTYFIRDVAGLRFERSIDRYFDTDQVAYRAIWRTDGRLLDATAPIAVYKGGTA